jgi:drug/metabolite transporter (DMT)-like permease
LVTFFMPKSSSPRFPPSVIIPLGILAVSTASVLIRYAQQEASSLTIAACRLILAVILLAPYVILRHRRAIKSLTGPDFRLALLSGVMLAVHFGTWISSLEYTSVASSVVLVSTTPLWVAVFAPLLLNEELSPGILIGMGLALLGGVIVVLADAGGMMNGGLDGPLWAGLPSRGALWGDGLAVVGAVSGAAYLMIGRHLREKFALPVYVFLVYGMAAVVLGVVMIAVDGLPTGFSGRTYLWLLLLALGPQLFGHTVFNWALRYLPSSLVSITLLGEPVGSTVLAAALLGERPSLLKIFGAILILLGIMTASSRKNREAE